MKINTKSVYKYIKKSFVIFFEIQNGRRLINQKKSRCGIDFVYTSCTKCYDNNRA